MLLSKRIKLILLAVIVMGITLAGVVNYTDACRLQNVTFNNKNIDNWQHRFGFSPQRSLLKQPLDSIAQALIGKKNIFKVDISYDLFHRLNIKTNNFQPICLVLDQKSGNLYGLNKDALIIPLNGLDIDWEYPVLTSVSVGKLYRYSQDVRVKVIIRQLEELRRSNLDFYRLIEEIKFGPRDLLKVTIAGLSFQLKMRTENFLQNINKFIDFITRFAPDLKKVKTIDLRYNKMIICSQRKA
ncbi:MAG: hypothetical protein GXO93_00580 [FCB group bacterium]|nr:hypothetical protein [FCB group bacterium]